MVSDPSATLYQIKRQILVINKIICDSIDTLDASKRGFLSQLILAHLRNFVEHIMLKVYAVTILKVQDIDDKWDNIGKATEFVKTRKRRARARGTGSGARGQACVIALSQSGESKDVLQIISFAPR